MKKRFQGLGCLRHKPECVYKLELVLSFGEVCFLPKSELFSGRDQGTV